MNKKSSWSILNILNMNVGFFGIQYSFGLQQSAVTPIYDILGAQPDQIPILHLAGPITGLIVQPLIGAMSDRTWSPKWGRRKPYFFIGALICSIGLLMFPFSSELWMAAGLLWLLDVGNNMTMEPYRAFVADVLPNEQYSIGFQMQSFFTGLGQFLSYISLFLFPIVFTGYKGSLPTWIYASFFLGAFLSLFTIWWSMRSVQEFPPSKSELESLQSDNYGFVTTLSAIWIAIIEMPKILWKLFLVYMFQWYALMCYWQNNSKSIALSVWKSTPENTKLYEEAVRWNGIVGAFGFIITFSVALFLAKLANKYSPRWVHFYCLLLAAISMIAFPFIHNQYLFFLVIIGYGIGWASIMGIPYLMVVDKIPKEQYGVYMGIINMMIVIPMIVQNLSFGYILKNFLGNSPSMAILFAGSLLFLSAILTLLVKVKENSTN